MFHTISFTKKMMRGENPEDLIVWKKAFRFSIDVYDHAISKLPGREKSDLGSQMRRSAVSIFSNITEGHQRGSNKEFANFLRIARGSNSEVRAQLIFCKKRSYVEASVIDQLVRQSYEIQRLLNALIATLE